MKFLMFAWKRTIGNRVFLVMLAVYAAAIVAASLPGTAGSYPPAGVCCGDDSAATRRIVAYLTDNGFVLCDDETQLREQVASGALDCGAVLPEGLSRLLEQGDTQGCVTFIASPLSFLPELYQSHVSAAIYRECAPYIAAKVLENLPEQELLEEYERRFRSGYVFSFELLTHDGAAVQESDTSGLMMGTVALLLFALLMGTGVDGAGKDLFLRLGFGRAMSAVVLPGVMMRGIFAFGAGSIGLCLAGAAHLIVPLAAYTLLLSALGVFLTAVLPEQRDRYILLAVILIASVALCPIFTDLTMLSPLLRGVRCALPPYWFYLAVENRWVWLIIGCGALILAYGAMCARWFLAERMVIGRTKKTGEQV